jgi:hypothetical protein
MLKTVHLRLKQVVSPPADGQAFWITTNKMGSHVSLDRQASGFRLTVINFEHGGYKRRILDSPDFNQLLNQARLLLKQLSLI